MLYSIPPPISIPQVYVLLGQPIHKNFGCKKVIVISFSFTFAASYCIYFFYTNFHF